MGQREIISFLQNQREMGNHDFITINQIKRISECNYNNTYRAIKKLKKEQIVEIDNKDKWQKRFRFKLESMV